MDVFFHAASAGLLARTLGERRPKALLAAALIGIQPDLLARVIGYSPAHSLAAQVPLALLLALANWRTAWGGLLHLAIDVFTHASSTRYVFYPWTEVSYPIGITWWHWPGLLLWAGAWLLLLKLWANTIIKPSA